MTTPQEREIDRLAQRVADLYAAAELRIAQRIAKALAQGIDAPDWAQAKLLELQLIQARIRGELKDLAGRALGEIAITIAKMRNLGNATAIAELDLYGITSRALGPAAQGTELQVRALLAEAVQDVVGQHARILRSVDDVYRQAVQQATGVQLTGAATRREMAQQALNEMATAGITGFVDSSGRRWSLTAHTEMSMRTAARRAQVIGHAERLQAEGYDLVQVSDHDQECPRCEPWENQVLSLSGATQGTIQIDGTRVAGTLDGAMQDGLFHPNCRHTINLYIPGVSRKPVGKADPQGYAARQEQRRLERGIREWKRREAVALDPATAARARAKVRVWQAKLREHLATHPELKRQADRESITVSTSLGLPGFQQPASVVPISQDARQDALGVAVDRTRVGSLTQGEIQFVERFRDLEPNVPLEDRLWWLQEGVRVNNQRMPSNDFEWRTLGIEAELKSPSSADAETIKRRIWKSANRAWQSHQFVKDHFVIDLGELELDETTRQSLAAINREGAGRRIARLFVLSRGVLEEIQLQ